MTWLTKAATQGVAPAQSLLGVYYQQGRGVPQDFHEAKRLFKLAADQGYTPAIAKLAAMLREEASAAQKDDTAKKGAHCMLWDHLPSNLKCSKEGCSFGLSIDLIETKDVVEKGKMKVCAACKQTQYCSKQCQSPCCSH